MYLSQFVYQITWPGLNSKFLEFSIDLSFISALVGGGALKFVLFVIVKIDKIEQYYPHNKHFQDNGIEIVIFLCFYQQQIELYNN